MELVKYSRRGALKAACGGTLAGLAAAFGGVAMETAEAAEARKAVRQSACRWCYNDLPLDELCNGARKIGLKSVELIGPEEFKVVKSYDLTCAVANGTGPIPNCLNRVENHERCQRELLEAIEFADAEKIPNVICFSGNRAGMSDEEGLANCVTGIKGVMRQAEKKGVTVVLELLNSKVDHIDYMGDNMAWGLELVERVGSKRFRLLYDIYHMQIMEGDVIRTIQEHHEKIAHYHTGGVPGRHEIDGTQELNYPAIIRAILDTGYRGFLGQEFVPTKAPLVSLAQGYKICDVT